MANSASYARTGSQLHYCESLEINVHTHHVPTKKVRMLGIPTPGSFQATQIDKRQAACPANDAQGMQARPSKDEYKRVCMTKGRFKGTSNEGTRDICGGQTSSE